MIEWTTYSIGKSGEPEPRKNQKANIYHCNRQSEHDTADQSGLSKIDRGLVVKKLARAQQRHISNSHQNLQSIFQYALLARLKRDLRLVLCFS
jgi:hypothetical protein